MAAWTQNPLLLTDSYKVAHHKQYPPGMTKMKAYFESRGGLFKETVFMGLQHILKSWFTTPVTMEMVEQADKHYLKHFGDKLFNREGWEYIVRKHNGKLPLVIKAVPEGTLVPVSNVLFTVENTDDETPWLATFFEALLVQVWYPLTVCTNSYNMKKMLLKSMNKTCDAITDLEYKLHDFGLRGVASVENAGIGGCAHLANFKGTDNNAAIAYATAFYGSAEMPGNSLPATEHSVMTSWGQEREVEATRYILNAYSDCRVSIVIDSYDLDVFLVDVVGKELKEEIMKRKFPLVLRPDSGEPKDMVIHVLNELGKIFPPTINSKGFKVLPDYIRIVQGDGVSRESLQTILDAMEEHKWSVDNTIFGSGGALLQRFDRDVQRCAFKCCMAVINGEERDVFKNPKTDSTKKSKAGDLTLIKTKDGEIKTVRRQEVGDDEELLVEVYRDGKLLVEYSLDDIRTKIDQSLKK